MSPARALRRPAPLRRRDGHRVIVGEASRRAWIARGESDRWEQERLDLLHALDDPDTSARRRERVMAHLEETGHVAARAEEEADRLEAIYFRERERFEAHDHPADADELSFEAVKAEVFASQARADVADGLPGARRRLMRFSARAVAARLRQRGARRRPRPRRRRRTKATGRVARSGTADPHPPGPEGSR